MIRSGDALRLALRDFYANSWRLVPVNALLGVALVSIAVAAVAVHALLVLAVLAGPLAAALAHCAVTLVRTGNLALRDALDGLRLHWRRGLQLGAVGTAFAVLVAFAVNFYAGSPFVLPLMFVALYLAVLLAVYQVVVLILVVADPQRSLRAVALALLVVNLAGIAAAVMPFLTLTVAYSFVAVAHFALPHAPEEESR
jgi:hypothetical protein